MHLQYDAVETANFAIFAVIRSQFSHFLTARNLQP